METLLVAATPSVGNVCRVCLNLSNGRVDCRQAGFWAQNVSTSASWILTVIGSVYLVDHHNRPGDHHNRPGGIHFQELLLLWFCKAILIFTLPSMFLSVHCLLLVYRALNKTHQCWETEWRERLWRTRAKESASEAQDAGHMINPCLVNEDLLHPAQHGKNGRYWQFI